MNIPTEAKNKLLAMKRIIAAIILNKTDKIDSFFLPLIYFDIILIILSFIILHEILDDQQ
jgi:hypothetical protein